MSWIRAPRVPVALLDALAASTGYVPNGRLPRPPRAAPLPGRSGFSDVVVKQPAAGPWGCDGCGRRGTGGVPLLEHARETEHRVFTAARS